MKSIRPGREAEECREIMNRVASYYQDSSKALDLLKANTDVLFGITSPEKLKRWVVAQELACEKRKGRDYAGEIGFLEIELDSLRDQDSKPRHRSPLGRTPRGVRDNYFRNW